MIGSGRGGRLDREVRELLRHDPALLALAHAIASTRSGGSAALAATRGRWRALAARLRPRPGWRRRRG